MLWLDADEVLQPGNAARLRRHAKDGCYEGIKLTLRDGLTEWLSPRFFHRTRKNRFEGRIHEWINIAGDIGTDRRIQILHRPDKRGKESSEDRNIRLLRVALEEDPDDIRTLFYLGNALLGSGAYSEAIKRYSRYEALGGDYHEERFTVRCSIAICKLLLGDFDGAIKAALGALHQDPRYAEAHCVLGDAWLMRGEPAYARQWFRSALACQAPPPEAPLFVDRSMYGSYPRHRLRQLRRILGP